MSKLLQLSSLSALAPEEAAAADREPVAVRHVLVQILGNRAQWQLMAPNGAVWRITPDRAGAVFACDPEGAADPAMPDRLSRALIKRVTVLESNTNIDEVVGVEIEGLPHKEFTANGSGASLFLTGAGRVTAPQDVFNLTGDSELGLMWMKEFPMYTAKNLDECGVVFLGTTFFFVHEEHPVILFMRQNHDTLGVHVTEDARFDANWFKIDCEAFNYAIKHLRENLLHMAPSTFDLTTLTVRIFKPDGEDWMQLSPLIVDSLVSEEVKETEDPDAIQAAKNQTLRRYVSRPLHITLRLAIEYALPDSRAGGKQHAAALPKPPACAQQQQQSAAAVSIVGGWGFGGG